MTSVVAQLRRPGRVVERTRWLFAWLSTVTLVTVLPAPLTAGGLDSAPLAVTSAAVLLGSWWLGYRLRRAPLALDLVDASCLLGLTLACPQPEMVVATLFSCVWFRTQYGSPVRSVIRALLLQLAVLIAAAVLWPYGLGPGHEVSTDAAPIVLLVPSLLVVVAVSSVLHNLIAGVDRAARRDATLLDLGQQLLGHTDRASVERLAWAAAVELCEALPDVRLLKVTSGVHGPVVEQFAGRLHQTVGALPAGLVVPAAGSGSDPDESGTTGWQVAEPEALDAAAGATLAWEAVALSDGEAESWLLLGAPREVPREALAAINGLANQTSLAYRAARAHRELAVAASTDVLTGLANRRTFNESLRVGLMSMSGDAGVLFVDIDDFKNVNDDLGHQAGDTLLQEIAERLRAATRDGDLVARLGGDEFAVFLPGVPPEVAHSVAARIVASISTPIVVSNGVAEVGASVGLVMATAGHPWEEVLRQADVAMYAAKAQGKNRVQTFHPGLLAAS